MEDLGDLVRRHRRGSGLTQQELAELAGVSVAGLRDVEQGRVRTPRPGTLRRLAEALSLSTKDTEDLIHTGLTTDRPADGLEVEVLGPLRVTVGGQPVDLGSESQRALLGVLALSPNVPVGRHVLIAAVWGDTPPPAAQDVLQSRLSRLRRRLEPSDGPTGADQVVTTRQGGYQLMVRPEGHDLLRFRQLCARAREARRAADTEYAADLFREANSLWRGDPLNDLPTLHDDPVVVALRSERSAAVVEYAAVTAELGRYDEVLPLLTLLAETDPLHEAIHAALMIALAGSGQQASALRVFDSLRHRLVDELGADPGPELTEAQRKVLRLELNRPDTAPVSAHRQMPPDIADFAGRDAELRSLHSRLPAPGTSGTALVVVSIEGMAGVGKTRLAVHLAHQLLAAGRYSDDQLYVDLRGHSDDPPADPSAVLASFLRLLGVPGDRIPPDVDGRAALYRDRMYGRNAVVLLDNAASEQQVLPLLPSSPDNLVLITSRRSLALDGAQALPVDVFDPDDAVALLGLVVGRQRVAAEPAAAGDVVESCGRLPLAVALAGRRLQSRPAWGLADLATRLRDADDRLSQLAAGTRRLRAVFDLSYHVLDAPGQRMFRLLGLHPGADFTAESAAALADVPVSVSRELLDHLVDEHLAIMVTATRYTLHDLLREHARAMVADEEDERSRGEAMSRLLNFYVHAVDRAVGLIRPHRWRVELVGTPPAHLPALDTGDQADQWMSAERAVLGATVIRAAQDGWPVHAWQLAFGLLGFLDLRGYFEEWDQIHTIAVGVTCGTGDLVGEAALRTHLGGVYLARAAFADAETNLTRALQLHRETGNRTLETTTLINLGTNCYYRGQFVAALAHLQRAAGMCAGSDPYREGVLRCNVGAMLTLFGRLEEAMENLTLALALSRSIGDHDNTSLALTNIGDIHRRRGRFDVAIANLEEAMALANQHALRAKERDARHRLGQTYHDLGQLDKGLACLTEALEVAVSLGSTSAEATSLVDLAAVHLDMGNGAEATALIGRALALTAKGQHRYEEARALAGLASVYEKDGRPDLAREPRARAHALFRELGIPEEADEFRA